jgi:hypothetical protein
MTSNIGAEVKGQARGRNRFSEHGQFHLNQSGRLLKPDRILNFVKLASSGEF